MNKFQLQLKEGFSIYLFTYLLTSIVTVFLIRIFLGLTKYPQISFADLHIAHILFGGLVMIIILLVNLIFSPSRRLNLLSAIFMGIGFGLFWDELGKYISETNDYFFKPALPIIYISFIIQFFVFLFLTKFDDEGRKELDMLLGNKQLDSHLARYNLIGLSVIRLLSIFVFIFITLSNQVSEFNNIPILLIELILYGILLLSIFKNRQKKLRDVTIILLILHFIVIGSYFLYLGQLGIVGYLFLDLIILILYIFNTN